MEKIDIKYSSMFGVLDELRGKEKDFNRYVRMVMRQPGIHKSEAYNYSGRESPSLHGDNASQLSMAKNGKTDMSQQVRRRISQNKIHSSLKAHQADEPKSGQFTISPQKDLMNIQETDKA